MLCIKNATVITMGESGVLEHGDVLMDGGKIVAVGRNLACSGEVIDATGLFVTPRDIDSRVRELGRLIGRGLTLALQPGLSAEEVAALLG